MTQPDLLSDVSVITYHHETHHKIIDALFPNEVEAVILPISDYTAELRPDEYKIISNASEKRKREFSTGRKCAKQALIRFSVNDVSILPGENREPLWPEGIIGSISHCKDLCCAVTTRNKKIASIGFDVENIKDLKENIAPHICTEEELDWLHGQAEIDQTSLALLFFSIKESLYKCHYTFDKTKTSFQDYTILPNLQTNMAFFSDKSKKTLEGTVIRFHMTQLHIYSSAILPI